MFDLPVETERGLRALKAIARHDGPVAAAELAREARVTPNHVARLLRTLKAAGLVAPSGSGRWALARPAGAITVLEAVEALGVDWNHRDDHDDCVLAPLCREAHETMLDLFRARTLADLRAALPVLP
jgi:Rrf2 family protein